MENSQSDVVQLTRLPGFGPKKVAGMDHVFEQPFHMWARRATRSPPLLCLRRLHLPL